MEQKEYSQFTDQELIDEAKKMKSFSIFRGLIIGFLVGIIFFSIAKNTWGILTLIPLYFIYKMVNDPKNKKNQDLQNILKERNIK